jgi:hypothetical protein
MRRGGFTLAEALAALVFMAIVIPVAVQGLRLANLAGQVSLRKGVAGRIADRVLNETVVTANSQGVGMNGTVHEGTIDYRWTARTEPWINDSTMRLLTVQVTFAAQGQDYDVSLSTLQPQTQ